MKNVIFFENECSGKAYFDFIDYAFSKTDYFMLVYTNIANQGYSYQQKNFKKLLDKFKVKSRTNPDWPSIYESIPDEKYKIVFYKTSPEAKEILKEVSSLYDWRALNPSDLSFFKGNDCWFSSNDLGVAVITNADKSDIDFAVKNGLAKPESISLESDEEYSYKEPGLA